MTERAVEGRGGGGSAQVPLAVVEEHGALVEDGGEHVHGVDLLVVIEVLIHQVALRVVVPRRYVQRRLHVTPVQPARHCRRPRGRVVSGWATIKCINKAYGASVGSTAWRMSKASVTPLSMHRTENSALSRFEAST